MCLTHQSQLAQSLLSYSTAFPILLQGWGTYPYFPFPSDLFCGPPGQQSLQVCKFSFSSLIIMRSTILAEIRWSVCMIKSHRSLCESFSRTGAGLCIRLSTYHVQTPKGFDLLVMFRLSGETDRLVVYYFYVNQSLDKKKTLLFVDKILTMSDLRVWNAKPYIYHHFHLSLNPKWLYYCNQIQDAASDNIWNLSSNQTAAPNKNHLVFIL